MNQFPWIYSNVALYSSKRDAELLVDFDGMPPAISGEQSNDLSSAHWYFVRVARLRHFRFLSSNQKRITRMHTHFFVCHSRRIPDVLKRIKHK